MSCLKLEDGSDQHFNCIWFFRVNHFFGSQMYFRFIFYTVCDYFYIYLFYLLENAQSENVLFHTVIREIRVTLYCFNSRYYNN